MASFCVIGMSYFSPGIHGLPPAEAGAFETLATNFFLGLAVRVWFGLLFRRPFTNCNPFAPVYGRGVSLRGKILAQRA
jgi:hypothetical protein